MKKYLDNGYTIQRLRLNVLNVIDGRGHGLLKRCCDSVTHLLRRESVFVFQAEDGIRDYDVTGVQTCALPICSHLRISYAVFCLRSDADAFQLQPPQNLV